MLALAPSVPGDLVAHQSGFLPGGQIVRDLLIITLTNALEDLQIRADVQARRLDAAIVEQVSAERALQEEGL